MRSDAGSRMTGELAACTFGSWRPGIGDPTAWGWITVLAYVLAAVLAARAARVAPNGRETAFWTLMMIGLGLLAVNKQLDLQSALTAAARCLSQAQGWYDTRRRVQVEFIYAIAAAAALLACGAVFAMRNSLGRLWLAISGTVVLLSFVTIRAASFHDVDALIGRSAFGVTANAAFEIGGIGLIAAGALRYAASGRRRQRR